MSGRISNHGVREVVVASGEGVTPSLNPFLPTGEADRQVAALVHEPLLRIGTDGEITAALVEKWSWTQKTSFWFSNEVFAQRAGEKLKQMTPEQWKLWRLVSADVDGTELRLNLSEVSTTTGIEVQKAVAEFGPLPVETIRVELKGDARSHHGYFMQEAVEARQVKAVWFDGPSSYEVRVSGETVKFFEELEKYYRNHTTLEATLRFISRDTVMDRPLLEMVLREGALFQDGTAVTSADVEATARMILGLGWPVQGVDALRLAGDWDTSATRHIRVTFRKPYGPAIMAFVGLPVLPKRWIDSNYARLAEGGKAFTETAPVGTGKFQLDGDNAQSLVLSDKSGSNRVQFMLDQTPISIRAGFAMERVDAFWPGPTSLTPLLREPGVVLRRTIPRNRLLVLWNCRREPTSDVRTREALGLGLDRTELMQQVLRGEGEIHEGLFQPGWWFASDPPLRPADKVRSKELFYEAGWGRDANGMLTKSNKTLRIELLTVAGNTDRIRVATLLCEKWRALGVDAVVTALPWEEIVNKRLPARDFDAALLGLDFERTWDQLAFWHSSQARRGLNFSGLADGQTDLLLSALLNENEPTRVKQLAYELEAQLLSLHPFLPLFSGGNTVAIRQAALPTQGDKPNGEPFSLTRFLEGEQP